MDDSVQSGSNVTKKQCGSALATMRAPEQCIDASYSKPGILACYNLFSATIMQSTVML